MQAVQKKFKDDKDVAFVAIQTTFEGHSTNTAKRALETAQKYKLPIPVGHAQSDRGSPQIMREFRSGGTPWVVIIDKEGVVRFNDFHVDAKQAEKYINILRKR